MRFLILLLLCKLLFHLNCIGQTDSNVKWVNKNTVQILSIDPENAHYEDLEPIKSAIDDARIVLLGEQEHGDGSTYLAKSRLVKFLHSEMGFNILAFESDFFGVNKAWFDYKKNKREYKDVIEQLYVFWAQSEMCQNLFKSIEISQQSNKPMILAGFDCQQLLAISKEELIPSLDSIINLHDIEMEEADKGFFFKVIKDAMKDFHEQEITDSDKNRFLEISHLLLDQLREKKADEFWIQEIDNLQGFMMHTWYWWLDRPNDMVNNNYRDMQMAENVLWLLNEKYKNEKIIIWAGNGHIIKSDTLFEVEAEEWKPKIRQYPMGEILFDTLKSDMYSIGFVTSKGKSSYVKYDEGNLFVQYDIEPADSNSFSCELNRTGFQYAFINLRGRLNSLTEIERRIRIWRPEYVKGKLSDIYDGVFYIEEMQANRKLD